MKDHLAYLSYVIRHKWFVFKQCMKMDVPLRQAVFHDWSKFLPSEWGPYVRTFYTPNGTKRYQQTLEFEIAWNYHQKRQPHHWQYWALRLDKGDVVPLPMPEKFIKEMVADWIGAGIAINGHNEVLEWYNKNKEKMALHALTRKRVEELVMKSDIEGQL